MYPGLGRLPLYPFIGVGFVVVMVAGVALVLVYAVGALRGRRAAVAHTRGCVTALAAGCVADIVWAVASGQWSGFMREIGLAPLTEMLVLAALFLFSVWFMAVRYTQGLSD